MLTRVNLPPTPSWVVPRPGLVDRLDRGVSGLVTVVSGPTGAGKTTATASWAAGAAQSSGVIWMNLARTGAEPDVFWRHLSQSWEEAGVRDLPRLPLGRCTAARRVGALADLGAALRSLGPWIVILDDYPTGPAGQLGSELDIVLGNSRRALRLVLIGQGDPAMDVHRHSAAGELTRVVGSELVMSSSEIAEVLKRHRVDATAATVDIVERHTAGWACGVRHAARSLQTAPTTAAAMSGTDRAVRDYMEREVLAKMTPSVRELIVRTSIVDHLGPDLARAIMGPENEGGDDLSVPPQAFIDQEFVEVEDDGAFRCHPLLRAAAHARFSRERPSLTRDARRRAAGWYIEHGNPDAALRLAIAAADWPCVARVLVESHAVPRILAGTASDIEQSAARVSAVGVAEPVVLAAVALTHRNVDAAEAALDRPAPSATSGSQRSSLADLLAVAFAELAVARLRGQAARGMEVAEQARGLLSQLPMTVHADAPELWPMLDAQVGAFEVGQGNLHRAALTLARGADDADGPAHADGSAEYGTTRSDCAGQLALLEAVLGNLGQATRRATSVLGDAGSALGAVMYAHVAAALVQVEQGDVGRARVDLDRASSVCSGNLEPGLVAMQKLVEARLLVAAGEPEAAVRLLDPALKMAASAGQSGWAVDQLVIASAEALLAAGEPQRALSLVATGLDDAAVESMVVTAAARLAIGDLRGASAALAAVAADLACAPRRSQVEFWLVEAQLAQLEGKVDRTRVLINRALRVAASEELRRPFAAAVPWFSQVVDRDVAIQRDHGNFLASLLSPRAPFRQPRVDSPTPSALIVETLSSREVEVLQLLAQMWSTREISAELYVSVNTVKTHLKGIFRKLCVNRRVDAVRRGRELHLC